MVNTLGQRNVVSKDTLLSTPTSFLNSIGFQVKWELKIQQALPIQSGMRSRITSSLLVLPVPVLMQVVSLAVVPMCNSPTIGDSWFISHQQHVSMMDPWTGPRVSTVLVPLLMTNGLSHRKNVARNSPKML